ncbi:hypothetical protein FIA58_016075 [Flavobacterium jejuense]|uniref:Uncharacterized protein n=1 Tax=Flavobacterium jejuense TaxID=1544455 RepID=A0ABX0ITH5_9FLAO|nr:hypothetical protein [Flavobacterium jejuense]NHN27200.1 hypothetical protein [Flavobacterium jejuense]
MGRVIYAITVLKTTSGKCKWQPIQIRQNYDGQKYGVSFVNGNMGLAIPSECSEAKKYFKSTTVKKTV